jgi:hypothetical protein
MDIPRGLEILVKKAAVDPAFREHRRRKRPAFTDYAAAALFAVIGAFASFAGANDDVTVATPPEVTAPDDAGVFTGRVVGPQENPVAGARLEIAGHDDIAATTDDGGFFRLGPLPPGEYTVVCTAQHMRPVSRENAKALAGYVTVINFELMYYER